MFVSKSMNECVDVNNGFFLLFSPVVVIRDDSTQRKSSKEGSVWGTIQYNTVQGWSKSCTENKR